MTTTLIRLHYADSLRDVEYAQDDGRAVARTLVWEGQVAHADDATPSWIAEVVYAQFQRVGEGHYENPALDGDGLRSMSVGDVVEIVGDDASTFWVAASLGFEELASA